MVYRVVAAVAVLFVWLPAAVPQAPFHVGNGVSAPMVIHKADPEYTGEARKARLNGSVVLYAVVTPAGNASDFRVIRSLGLGLDENAIAAVGQWRFRAGEKEGKPVSVLATIEVNFRLLPNHSISQPAWYSRRVLFQTPAGATRPALVKCNFPAPVGTTQEGSVTVTFLIDEQGVPRGLRAEKSSASGLENEALAIIQGWRFSAALQDGRPIAVAATIELAFGAPGVPSHPAPRTQL